MKLDPEKVKAARLRAGLTAAQLAAIVGVSRPYISMIETGKKPYLVGARVESLCLALRCNQADVVTSRPVVRAARGPRRAGGLMAKDIDGPTWEVGKAKPAPGEPRAPPDVERMADGSIRYHFVSRWRDADLMSILPSAQAAEDWDLVQSIAAEMRRRRQEKPKG